MEQSHFGTAAGGRHTYYKNKNGVSDIGKFCLQRNRRAPKNSREDESRRTLSRQFLCVVLWLASGRHVRGPAGTAGRAPEGAQENQKTAGEGAGKLKNAQEGRRQKKQFYFPRRRGAGKLKIPQAVRRKIEIPVGGAQKKYFRRQ